jgi:hypothetical protein
LLVLPMIYIALRRNRLVITGLFVWLVALFVVVRMIPMSTGKRGNRSLAVYIEFFICLIFHCSNNNNNFPRLKNFPKTQLLIQAYSSLGRPATQNLI